MALDNCACRRDAPAARYPDYVNNQWSRRQAFLRAERNKKWAASRKHWRHWLNVHACKSSSRFLVRMLVTLRYLLKSTAVASVMTTPDRSGWFGMVSTGRLMRQARAIVQRSKLRVRGRWQPCSLMILICEKTTWIGHSIANL